MLPTVKEVVTGTGGVEMIDDDLDFIEVVTGYGMMDALDPNSPVRARHKSGKQFARYLRNKKIYNDIRAFYFDARF